MRPLDGIRVLDLSQRLPGPYCTMLMADYGAEVIKVERPDGGDFTRSVAPRIGPDSAVHWIINRNKKSVTLDLKRPADQQALHALAATADVVVEGFRPGVARRLAADYGTLAALNPRLIYCAISGYGQDGPYRDQSGHDINYMAIAGVLALGSGQEGEPPPLSALPAADLAAGSLLALCGILLALRAREATGRGQYIDVAMTDGLLALLPLALADVAALGAGPGRGELLVTGAYPCYAAYATGDGRWLTLGLLEADQWRRFCARLEQPGWVPHQFDRGEQAAAIRQELVTLFASRPLSAWEAFFSGSDLCIAPVQSLEEALGDPQLAHRGVVTRMADASGRDWLQLAPPIRLSETPGELRRPAPRLGEHNGEILGRPDGTGTQPSGE